MKRSMRKNGFSLIELVIVVVIIGIIGAIAIPRMSRGAAGASDASLSANLSVLRSAIDLYTTEHGGTPPTVSGIVNQLTLYSNDAGATSGSGGASHPYGPYLRSVPKNPVGTFKGKSGIAAASGAGIGWIYDETKGNINANAGATEKDIHEKLYTTY